MPTNVVPRKAPIKQNPSAVKLPIPVLKGTYDIVDSVVTWQGLWGMSADAFQQEGQTSSFCYRKKGDQSQTHIPIRFASANYFESHFERTECTVVVVALTKVTSC